MPDFPIIDAHVHIFDPKLINYPWMAGVPKLNKPHLPADYRRLTAPVVIDTMVFVEVDAARSLVLDEADFVNSQAADDPRIKAIVASAPVENGASVEPVLKALAAKPRVKGIRSLIQGHVNEPGWALRESFLEGLSLLPKHGLSFDICILHPQMKDVIEMVRRLPDVSFVLDHIGKPGIKAGLKEPWMGEITALAGLPNVVCKISGVVTEADHAGWTEAECAPYVAHAINAFGYDRVMFGGDWPVSELATDYPRWVALVDQVTAKASTAEKRKLWRETAANFYRL